MEGTKLDRFKAGTEKLLGRTNERLKQKMGRSSESVIAKDDKWQVITANFNRQQAAGLRLHREVKGYIASLKTLESSTQTLLDAVREMHEYTWPGNMNLVKALQGLDKLNRELNESMVDALLVPVNNYVEVFSQMKVKMQKRERKLLDYTRSKRSLDTLKKGDKISPEKLGFAQDNFTQNKMIFEEVNTELCEDLPALWESRKTYIMKFLDGFFSNSVDFHKEFSQVYSESSASLEPLKEQIKNELPPLRDVGKVDRYFVVSEKARKLNENIFNRFKRQSSRKSFRKSGSFKRSLSMGALRKTKKNQDTSQSISNVSVDPYVSPAQQATVYTPAKASPVKTMSPTRPKPPKIDVNAAVEIEAGDATPYSPSINVEPGTVVECIHEYKAVDDDELSFKSGDVITVVAWDSTDEQDAGWFMGVLQGSGAKGAFPINYTRKHTIKKNIGKDPDPLDDTFQSVDLSAEDEWRSPSKKGAEYINLPELPEEQVLTNGSVHGEVEPVEYSYPPVTPPKRPSAPVVSTPATAEIPDFAAAVSVETPPVEVGADADVKVAAAISFGAPEVEEEAEKLDLGVGAVESEVTVDTQRVGAPGGQVLQVEADVEISGGCEGLVSSDVDAAVEVTEEGNISEPEKETNIAGESGMEISFEIKAPENFPGSDSGDELSPEEIQQKLAALGEISDENNESDGEEQVSSPRVKFETSSSMLDSVPEDERDPEEESEASSAEDQAGEKADNLTAL